MSIQSLLIHTVDIYQISLTIDGTTLKPTHGYELLKSGVKARIEALAGEDRESIIGRFPRAKWRAFFPFDAPTTDGSIVYYNGKEYIIQNSLFDNNRERNNYITCILEERKG